MGALGARILSNNPGATDVRDKLAQLAGEQRAIADLWAKRNHELSDASNLQVGAI